MGIEVHHRYRNPWTLDTVRAVFMARGCVLLETEYKRTSDALRYLCPSGHECVQRFDHFKDGHGCMKCRNARRWAGRRLDLETIASEIEEDGYADVDVFRSEAGRIRVEYTCRCGHRVTTGYQKYRSGQRCGPCAMAALRGAGHPNYNHELTDEERVAARKYDEYAAWRTAVFARDGYTCRKCRQHGGRLNAHHIQNFREAPEQRTAIENGATLCKRCHIEFHKSYGYRHNDHGQLDEYLADGVPCQ